ncbi:MAG TPA: PAS domain S-box protein [Nitrospirota bacterium]
MKKQNGELPESGDQRREEGLLYHALFSKFPDGILIVDFDGSFIDFNEAAHRQLGYTREEFARLRISDIDPVQTPEDVKASIREVLDKGSAEFEVKHRTKEGEIQDVHVVTQLLPLSGRTVFHTIWRDITKRKQAQAALRESENKYRDLFENANDAIFIIDADLNYIDANKRATELFGYSRKEFLKMKILDLIPPEQAPRSESEFKKLWERGAYEKFTGKLRTKDGRWLDIEVSSSAIVKGGKIIGARDIVRDITERKRMEDALRSSENLLQTIIETEPECVKLVAPDGALLMMNRAGLEMLEVDAPGQVIGKSIYSLVAPEHLDALKKTLKEVFQGKNGTLEFDAIGFKGKRLRLETRAVPLRNTHNEIIAMLAVTRNVTERKKLEEELIRAQKLDSVGLLAGGIAHDFNNLLTAILGNISLAKNYLHNEDKAFIRLGEAESASLRAKDLTRQLLTFSRGGAPVKTTVSLGTIIREAAGFALRGADVRCRLVIPEGLWPVEADEGQMSQVINNMIINADQSMPEGGCVDIECKNVAVREEDALPLRSGDYVKISIQDHGIGIAPEHLSKIFDPYFTTKQKGSGFGLAITYSIIKRHEGFIAVESQLGRGTSFYIYLPASRSGAPLRRTRSELHRPGSGRILIMDDEEAVRSVAAEMLKSLGYEVEVAKDGEEAITLYAESKKSGKGFHAVIMDLTVPGGMGGKDAVKKLLDIDPAVKAIVSSGYSNDEIMADHKKYGFTGMIAKPYKLATLSEVVNAVLRA